MLQEVIFDIADEFVREVEVKKSPIPIFPLE
jgi:hypothetical protein